MKFNINEKVRVRLTDHGRAVHEIDHYLFWQEANIPDSPAYTPPEEDENGWSEWQLWTLMHAFGKHLYNGSELCFETTIELVTPNAEVTGRASAACEGPR
ncbi:MAG TPA: hypothetical protein PLN96_05055 [Zoogloea sp.]|uniref:hypothetical protein n=1 Tax=Zoogloea sp. TaxID=49181 RepID=UPI002C864ED7|nr:hypothetical protein [Zoogloea sp.]HNA67293.1 hypothetical protein [Rhodocyclaceae bacterium]HNI47205.1 hypothetical protein [Zoogloea sp.]